MCAYVCVGVVGRETVEAGPARQYRRLPGGDQLWDIPCCHVARTSRPARLEYALCPCDARQCKCVFSFHLRLVKWCTV